MDSFDLGFIIGTLFAGIPAGVMSVLTYQWWKGRGRWRRIELDPYTERLRALDRGTRRVP